MPKNVTSKKIGKMSDFQMLYQSQIATLTRFKKIFTVAYLAIDNEIEIKDLYGQESAVIFRKQVTDFLTEQLRETDFIFATENMDELMFIFPYSGAKEIISFFERVKHEAEPVLLMADGKTLEIFPRLKICLLEIKNKNASYADVLQTAQKEMTKISGADRFLIKTNNNFTQAQTETIKFSIIEADEISANILENTFQRLQMESFLFEIKTFADGVAFLDSKWHLTDHTHFIFINDILPRKEGLEIIHELRELPNESKYIIFILSSRKTEDLMTYAYEQGVDEYISRPFHLKMIEAKVKRYLKRLR